LFKGLKNIYSKLTGRAFYKSILVRVALLSWLLVIVTLLIYITGIIPSQKEVLKERMKTEAKDIASSIGQVTATAIINNDYGYTVDYCLKMIKQSNSILYIVVTRNDGFSLVHTANSWREDTIKNALYLPKVKGSEAQFIYSSLVEQEVFHFSYPFTYSGINWGRINIGMSVTSFNKNMNNLYYKTVWLALLSIFVALLAAIYFAKNLTAPIRQLDNVAGQISNGDLSVRVKIKSEDEIGRLASTFNKMTDSLKSSQDTLERKVEERTAELGEANRALHTQINEKLDAEKKLKQYNSQLEAFDKIYKGIIAAKSDVQIIEETLTQMPILFNFINNAAVAIEDYTEDFVTIHSMKINKNGQNSFFNIKLPLKQKYLTMEDNPIVRPVIVNDIRQLKIKNQMEENLLKDGLISYTSVPLRIEQDRIGILGIMCDRPGVFNENHKATLLYFSNQLAVAIHQAQLQEQIKKHAKSLQNSLSEKEILLKEIHHRVKNNLQVISSLLYLNSRRIKDDDTLNMFKDSQNRVKSIALVHERLYQSKDLASINFKEYANRLITDLTNSYGVNHKEIKINIDIQNISISIDNAVPCGLIINELISNSLKYAFPRNVENKTECKIDITAIRNENNEVILSVKDNGKGFSLKSGDKKESSLGLQLVETLVKQLDGTMELDVSSGAAFLIKFKEINI